jgi:acylphosphatase
MRNLAAARLTISGTLDAPRFLDWIAHRAALLALSGWACETDAGTLEIRVAGPAPLIDAMEVACSLGPTTCLVDAVRRDALAPDDAIDMHGFRTLPRGGAHE